MRSQFARYLAIIAMVIAGIFASVSPVSAEPGPPPADPTVSAPVGAASLEQAPASTDTDNPWAGKTLLSFGGSYVSGFGADTATTVTPDDGSYDPDQCFRSKYAGTRLAAEWLEMYYLPFPCAGAEPVHIYATPQEGKGEPAQLDRPEVDTADAFAFQVRGNPELVRLVLCYYNPLTECVSSGNPDQPSEYDLIRHELVDVREAEEQQVYDILAARNPDVQKFAEGFPKIGPPRNADPGPCRWFLSLAEVNSMDDLLDAFNGSVQRLADRNGAVFVDMMRPGSPWTQGRHDMCAGPDAWVWGARFTAPVNLANPLESVNSSNHLTIAGQQANGVVLAMTMRENPPR